MTANKLIGMAVVLALLAGAALWQRHGRELKHTVPAVTGAATLLEGIDLNALTRLDVAQGSNTVALVKKDGRWVVDSLYGCPADFNRLADALRAMADVKTGTPVRSENVDDSEFGLTNGAKTVTLKTGDGKSVAAVTIGARRAASDAAGWANQFFIRKSGGDSVYLVDYDFQPFSSGSTDWISKELLAVPSSEIVAVREGGVSLKLNGADWTLTDLNPDSEVFQGSEANRLRSALQYLNCTTVADPSKTDAELGFDKPAVYVAQTKDGFTYTVQLGAKTGDGQFARLAVEYTRPEPPAAPSGDDKDRQEAYSKTLAAFNNTAAAGADKADRLNAQFSKWTYVISGYTADSLLIPRDKLVKTKEDKTISADTP